MPLESRLSLLKHSITNSYMQKSSPNITEITEIVEHEECYCILPVETRRGDERYPRSSSRRKKRAQLQRNRKSLSAKCLWPNSSEENEDDILETNQIFLSEEIPLLNNAIKESTKIENEVQLMIDSVEKISKKCAKAPTNYLQNLLPGIDLEKHEYLKFIVDSVMDDDNFPQLKQTPSSTTENNMMLSSGASASSNLSFFSESNPDLMTDSFMDDFDTENLDTPCRKISDIWNHHNKLHYEKIKLHYQLQSTQIALNRTVAASRKLPLFTKSDLMKFETPKRNTNVLRRTNSTSKCYVKKKLYSFEKFTMSSSFSEMSKWQR